MLENILLNDCFDTTVRTNALTLVLEDSERSWNFKIIKEYEPCIWLELVWQPSSWTLNKMSYLTFPDW